MKLLRESFESKCMEYFSGIVRLFDSPRSRYSVVAGLERNTREMKRTWLLRPSTGCVIMIVVVCTAGKILGSKTDLKESRFNKSVINPVGPNS